MIPTSIRHPSLWLDGKRIRDWLHLACSCGGYDGCWPLHVPEQCIYQASSRDDSRLLLFIADLGFVATEGRFIDVFGGCRTARLSIDRCEASHSSWCGRRQYPSSHAAVPVVCWPKLTQFSEVSPPRCKVQDLQSFVLKRKLCRLDGTRALCFNKILE